MREHFIIYIQLLAHPFILWCCFHVYVCGSGRGLVLKTCLPAKPHLHLQKILKGMILHEHLPNLLDIFHTIKRPEWHSDSKWWLWCKEDHQRKNQLERLYFLTGTHSTFPYMPCAAEMNEISHGHHLVNREVTALIFFFVGKTILFFFHFPHLLSKMFLSPPAEISEG